MLVQDFNEPRWKTKIIEKYQNRLQSQHPTQHIGTGFQSIQVKTQITDKY